LPPNSAVYALFDVPIGCFGMFSATYEKWLLMHLKKEN